MVCKLLRLAKVNVVFILKTLIEEDALLLRIDQGLSFNLLFQAKQWSHHGSDRSRQSLELDLLLAGRARHEGKGDSKRGPSVPEKFDKAACVKDVATRKSRACLRAKL